jgi:hypothetical protein
MNLILIGFTVIFVWITISFRKIKHKIFALLLVSLLLLGYLSFTYVVNPEKIELSTLKDAGKIYVNYLNLVFNNIFTISGYAVNLDWSLNSSVENRSFE